MWRQPPIWEPQGTKFRPYSIDFLIFFYIGRLFGRFVWPASLIVVEHPEGTQIIFCSFHNFLNVRVAASRLCF